MKNELLRSRCYTHIQTSFDCARYRSSSSFAYPTRSITSMMEIAMMEIGRTASMIIFRRKSIEDRQRRRAPKKIHKMAFVGRKTTPSAARRRDRSVLFHQILDTVDSLEERFAEAPSCIYVAIHIYIYHVHSNPCVARQTYVVFSTDQFHEHKYVYLKIPGPVAQRYRRAD
jgi:hypothetical protein